MVRIFLALTVAVLVAIALLVQAPPAFAQYLPNGSFQVPAGQGCPQGYSLQILRRGPIGPSPGGAEYWCVPMGRR